MGKKGVSAIVGYVLLITFGIVMAVIVYGYLKTYVPRDALECPDSVSVFVKDYSCSSGQLNLTIKNNGKFNVAGYFIFAANETEVNVATIPMVPRFINGTLNDPSIKIGDGYIIFNKTNQNDYMVPKKEIVHYYDVSGISIKLIEIIPVRFQEVDGVQKFTSCGKARIREEITCS